MTTESPRTASPRTPVRLVAVDMDGTFLDRASTYDRARFDAIHARLRAAGVHFVVASGNQYWQLRTFFEAVPDVHYVAENGALIGTRDEILRVTPLPAAAVRDTLALLAGEPDILTSVCAVRSAYVRADAPAWFVTEMRRYNTRLELIASWDQLSGTAEDDVCKLTLECPPAATAHFLDHLGARLPDGIAATSSGHGSIDLIGADATKGTALAWLGERLGVAPAQMLAFGDGGNDVEMLDLVGHAVAMGNAPDAVKARADVVAARNDEAGVLAHLEALLDGGAFGVDPTDGPDPRASGLGNISG